MRTLLEPKQLRPLGYASSRPSVGNPQESELTYSPLTRDDTIPDQEYLGLVRTLVRASVTSGATTVKDGGKDDDWVR